MSDTVRNDLFGFAFVARFDEAVEKLKNLVQEERWSSAGVPNDNRILKNFISHTYSRLAYEYNSTESADEKNKKIAILHSKACFNTGLFSRLNNPVYAAFTKNSNTGRQEWFLQKFAEQSDIFLQDFKNLPEPAKYFESFEHVMYNTSYELRINISHILDPNRENLSRIPAEIRDKPYLPTLLLGAIENVKKQIQQNFKTAVPQYYQGEIQFLLPICLTSLNMPDVALAVSRQDGFYIGHTCLTLEMAYNNARLLSKPMSDWLVL